MVGLIETDYASQINRPCSEPERVSWVLRTGFEEKSPGVNDDGGDVDDVLLQFKIRNVGRLVTVAFPSQLGT